MLIPTASANITLTFAPTSTAGSTWTNPNNIMVDDGAYSTTLTQYSLLYGKTFNVNQSLAGVNVTAINILLKDIVSDSGIKNANISVTWDGGTTFSTEQTVTFPIIESYSVFSFVNETTWNVSKLSNSNFFVRVNFTSATSANLVHIDYMQLNLTLDAEVGNWTLDNGTGTYANDSSGFNNNGTINGAAWDTDSVNGSALFFDGNDVVTVNTSTSLNFTTEMSWSGWFKLTQTPAAPAYVFLKGASMYSQTHALGNVTPVISMSGLSRSNNYGALTLNRTYYLTFTYDANGGAGNFNTYKDGVLYSSVTAAGTINTDSGALYFGSNNGANGIDAVIDEWKFYNYDLTTTEITTDYQRFHPVPAYPTNMTIAASYPPQITSINFSWHDTEYPADELIVSKDATFNQVVVDIFTSNDYYAASLDSGQTYYWKVQQYNGTSATYGDTSQIETFTISSASGASGQGIEGIVYELIGSTPTPISGATVYIYNTTWSSLQIVGSNGYYLFPNLANDTYNVYALKQNYDTTAAFPVTVNGSIVQNNILIKKTISPYVPNFVYEKFTVRGLFGDEYPDVSVVVYEGDSQAALYTATTDTAGQVVFQLIKDQKYRLTFAGGGIDGTLTINIYGKEENYLVTIIGGFPTGGDRNSDITSNLTVTTVNSTHSNLSLIYNDTTSSTSIIYLYATNLTTNSTCYQTSTSNSITLNCTVLASGTYQFGFNATSSTYGFFKQDKIINFDVGQPSDALVPTDITPADADKNLLQWVSIIIIVLTASLFSIQTVKFGAVIVPLEALTLWAFGWFEPLPGDSVLANSTILAIAVSFGIMVYMRQSEAKVNTT